MCEEIKTETDLPRGVDMRKLAVGLISFAAALVAGLFIDASARAQQLNPKETAVLFVDCQNEFASETGNLYPILKDELKRKNVLENAVSLMKTARERGMLIVHTTAGYSPGYAELDAGNPGLFHKIVRARKAFVAGSPGVELWDQLRPGPKDTDIILKGRTAMSGFRGTDLNYVLRSKGIKNLAIAGFVTNICVEQTGRDAYDLGFHNYFLADVMAAKNAEDQAFTEKNNFTYIGKVTSWREFVDMIAVTQ
jgi:nicotinamidase-related amidase